MFLPENYEPPQSGNYMKFVLGDNRFRVLGPAIVGNVFWHTDDQGGRKPIRRRPHEKIESHELGMDKEGRPEKVKHFWAMPVWNYNAKAVQILEVTQSTVREAITALYQSEDWGDPTGYDIIVKKSGSGLDTEYSVIPGKPGSIPADIANEFARVSPNLDALFEGGDPFANSGGPKQVSVAGNGHEKWTLTDATTAVLEAGIPEQDFKVYLKSKGLKVWKPSEHTQLAQDFIATRTAAANSAPIDDEAIPFSPLPWIPA